MKKTISPIFFGILLVCGSCAATRAAEESMVTLVVTLDGEPAMMESAGPKAPVSLAQAAANSKLRGRKIKSQHDALQPKLDAAGAIVISHFSRLANAVKIRVPADKADLITKLPGVLRVARPHRYRRGTVASVPFIGAPQVWGSMIPNVDGRGVRIGIIDTGIDYTHADFGGSGNVTDYTKNDHYRLEPGTFPTAKVVGGFDFVGDNYDPSDPAHAVPTPDPDPLDVEGHGTHVAGIVAGFGVLTNGLAYQGPYNETLNFSQFSLGPGVAPKALLYALKVFGKGDTEFIADALEWAADPNGDYDFSDRLDVINLSLGEDFGLPNPEDPELDMINRLSELGCVVAVSAGNAGNTFYVVSAPSTATRAISVASSRDNNITGDQLSVLSPPSIAGFYLAVEGSLSKSLTETGPVEGPAAYVEPNDACGPISNAIQIKGKIALIDRGTCFFSDKVQAVQDAGAVAAVVVNNEPGDPFVMGSAGPDYHITIPAIMIGQSDGLVLKAALGSNLVLRLDGSLVFHRTNLTDTLSDFSSRGPSSANVLKPEIAAPGEAIQSALVASGNKSTVLSGTSMAAPHISGTAALMKQLHPDWTVEDIKAALMNTARQTHDTQNNAYPESMTGAGQVRVNLAAKTEITASADDSGGLVSLSFGDLQLTNILQTQRLVRIKNHGSNEVVCSVSVSNTISQAGFVLVPATNQVTVPAHGSATVAFDLTADPALFNLKTDILTPAAINGEPRQFLYEASGELFFHSESDTIHLPYYATLRQASSFHAQTTTVFVGGGPNASAHPELSIPIRGTAAGSNAVMSVFQTGYTAPSRNFADPIRASGDLLAVGAASDASSYAQFSDSTLYIGLATEGSWATPQPTSMKFQVLIDTDLDGIEDFTLYNGPDVLNVPGSDVFYSVLDSPLASGEIVSYLNVFSPDELETALFDNSVLVLSVPVEKLGLTTDSSRVRYKVQTGGRHLSSVPTIFLVDATPWIEFDTRHPVVDSTWEGKEHTPFLPVGSDIPARLDMQAALDSSLVLPSLLVLHHFNTAGSRYDIVKFDLTSSDSDRDGLPDWWENEFFKNLTTANSQTDFDKDGLSDLQEFQSGTNPIDPRSNFKLAIAPRPNGGITLSWGTVAGKKYMIQRTKDLEAGFVDYEPVSAPTVPVNIFGDITESDPVAYFYRVIIQ
jgi:subtilisin family serine protease